ncbi:hypothetical protein [Actinophytocola sediminis]
MATVAPVMAAWSQAVARSVGPVQGGDIHVSSLSVVTVMGARTFDDGGIVAVGNVLCTAGTQDT